MRFIGKLLIVIIIVGILLGASAYVIFYTGENNNNSENNEHDTEPPQMMGVSGNLTVNAGKNAVVTAQFTDNVNVTVATLYYKSATATSWTTESILQGSAAIMIPSSATSNYYYYVTVDDAAGNGPVGDPSVDGTRYYTITVIPGGGPPQNETLVHTVFIEEATADWCINCPNIGKIIDSLYESHQYNFYYVELINDSTSDTTTRLWDDYNIYGFPTVFVDGGYNILVGGSKTEADIAQAITAAQQRTVPKIKVTVTAQYKNTTQEVTVSTLVENKGNTTYNGQLKLYLTEIISPIVDYDSKNYHFGFLEYLENDPVSIPAQENFSSSKTKNVSAYNYENLMIIAVVFNAEKHQGYANPFDSTKNLFDAYYADATNATKVVPKGNLPPQLQITSPLKGNIYLNGKLLPIVEKTEHRKHFIKKLQNYSLLKNLLYNKTYLLGRNKLITVDATDDSAIVKVEFYIDGVLHYNDTQAPYEWSFIKIAKLRSMVPRTHTLKVIVYDDSGKTASASLAFKARI
jgi:hypothetical protein